MASRMEERSSGMRRKHKSSSEIAECESMMKKTRDDSGILRKRKQKEK